MRPVTPPPTWSRRRQRLCVLVQQAAIVRAGCRWGRPFRGWDGQAFARQVEDAIRFAAVLRCRWARRHLGRTVGQVAAALGVSTRTLRHWLVRWRKRHHRHAQPRGAPVEAVARDTRDRIFWVLALVGADAPVALLTRCFPDVPRSLLRDFATRVRRWWRRKHRVQCYALRWTRPGAVWAIDLRQEDAPTDGGYPYTVLVRDLGSGYQLAAAPVRTKEAGHVAGLLARLFAVHGAPLLLKSDNGGELTGEVVQQVCRRFGVWALRSPPDTPQYNGSIEAGGGHVARRAWEHAARHDRPEQWTCEDFAYAVAHGNAASRPFGAGSPTPDAGWAARDPITPAERAEFRRAVQRAAAFERYYSETDPASELDPWRERDVARAAIVETCIETELLTFRRRRYSPPKTVARWSRIA